MLRVAYCMTDQFFRELPELSVGLFFAWIGVDAVNTGQNTDDIAVQNGRGLIEGDAANRTSGVATDAWQGENGVESLRELAAVVRDNLLRGFLHVADAGVVAEAFPEFVDFVSTRVGKGFDGG